jgi:hypothetical protein
MLHLGMEWVISHRTLTYLELPLLPISSQITMQMPLLYTLSVHM